MNICIFPGTFNPIHKGHLKIAEYTLNKYHFDKIIFIPSYIPPHKILDKNLSKHRFEMIKLAIKNNNKFEISDIEYKSEEKSYSINTVSKIIEQYNINNRLNFIIGTDAFAQINTWYKANELKRLVHFIVFPRKGYNIEHITDWDYELVDMEMIDISSTNIRNGITNDIINVEGYIKDNGLYRI